jgi:hypothetical protein
VKELLEETMEKCDKLDEGWGCIRHRKTGVAGRVFLVGVAALIPALLLLLATGLTTKLDDATAEIGYTFIVSLLVVIAAYIGCVAFLAWSDKWPAEEYFLRGLAYPSTLLFGGRSIFDTVIRILGGAT